MYNSETQITAPLLSVGTVLVLSLIHPYTFIGYPATTDGSYDDKAGVEVLNSTDEWLDLLSEVDKKIMETLYHLKCELTDMWEAKMMATNIYKDFMEDLFNHFKP